MLLLGGAFWDAEAGDAGYCKVCNSRSTYNCPEALCTAENLYEGVFWDAMDGTCRDCKASNTYYCPEEMCTADRIEGAFWDADEGRCRKCTGQDSYYCPQEMCTTDVHEGALPYTWQCDP